MADICATCAYSHFLSGGGRNEHVCEFEFTGALQYDEATGKITDCEDYEGRDNG